jgi:poly-gamma-glutamate synthesis protein (capsule biosynthesis protein)
MKSRTITILAALILGVYALSGCGVSQASEPNKVVVEDPTEPVTKTVSISGSGDVLAHSRQYNVAWNGKTYDFSDQFSKLPKLLTADVNLCHLETPLSKGTPSGYPVFSTPVSLATSLKAAGWDGCSIASNHSLDQGKAGVLSTLKFMQAAELVTAGAKSKATGTTTGWYTTDQGQRNASSVRRTLDGK